MGSNAPPGVDHLTGRVALVTGGANGIGRSTCLGLSAAGASIVIADVDVEAGRDVEREIRARGGQAIFRVCDVSETPAVGAAIEELVASFGGLDVVVNDAAISGGGRSLLDTTEADWDRVMSVNLKSQFLVAVAAVPHLVRRGGGAIINVSSVLASATLPGTGVYSVSKAAIVGLTKTMALEWAALRIRVNCVMPGSTDTAMMWAGLTPDERSAARAEVEQSIPLGRVGDPADVAAAVVWLASDAASFVTGSSIVIDGGASTRFPAPR